MQTQDEKIEALEKATLRLASLVRVHNENIEDLNKRLRDLHHKFTLLQKEVDITAKRLGWLEMNVKVKHEKRKT